MSVKHLSPSLIWENIRELWPFDVNINRDYLFIKDYRPKKFEASEAKGSQDYCTKFGGIKNKQNFRSII